jgi:adenylate cyclase
LKKLARFARRFGLGRLVCSLMLVGLVGLRIWDPAPLEELRLRTFDFYQRLAPRAVKIRPAVVVDLDEKSLAKYGQWPWPRTLVADLIGRLGKAGAAAIGMDVLFAEPDRLSPALAADTFRGLDEQTKARLQQLPSNDDVLAAKMAQTRVVLGESGHFAPLPVDQSLPPPAGFATLGPDPQPLLLSFPGLIRNTAMLERAAAGRGLLNFQPEADGIVRRIPLVMIAQGIMFPALSLDMLRVVTGAGAILIRSDNAGIKDLVVGGLQVPTDRNGQLWIHFSRHDPLRYVSAADVLDGTVPSDRFKRRLVLIGSSAVGLSDLKTTPIDPAMPGVEVHAQVLENILTHSFLQYPNYATLAELAAAVLAGMLIIATGPIVGATYMFVLGAVIAALLSSVSWYFFTHNRLLLDATFPLLSTLSIYFTLVFINYFREQAQRRRIRFAFGQYLAAPLVEQLANSPEKLVLGGEVRNMTILFSDVRGFTTISEMYKDDPQGLTSLMNHFLTPMTNTIIEHNGTIDKYIGDAIMAFWNAPLDDATHEVNACRASLELLQRVEMLNEQRKKQAVANDHKFIPIRIGIGLNTGHCVVGNMGSDLRFNYSVLGDPVNLASRLEGQTKTYGLPIIVGARTAQAAQGTLAVLEVDCITVKGKTEPEAIYTVLGDGTIAVSTKFRNLQDALIRMLARYRAADFRGAEDLLDECRKAAAGFGLEEYFDVYAERLHTLQLTPPPASWNGVWVMESK